MVVAHAFNPSTQEAEAGGSEFEAAWSTGLYEETVLKYKTNKQTEKDTGMLVGLVHSIPFS